MPPPGQLDASLWDQMRWLPMLFRATGLGRLHRAPRLLNALEHVHPQDPHFYLWVIAVLREKRRTGIGSALMNAVLARCDRERIPVYLENSAVANLPFYERFGFETVGKLDAPAGGPHLWLMWREPA